MGRKLSETGATRSARHSTSCVPSERPSSRSGTCQFPPASPGLKRKGDLPRPVRRGGSARSGARTPPFGRGAGSRSARHCRRPERVAPEGPAFRRELAQMIARHGDSAGQARQECQTLELVIRELVEAVPAGRCSPGPPARECRLRNCGSPGPAAMSRPDVRRPRTRTCRARCGCRRRDRREKRAGNRNRARARRRFPCGSGGPSA